MMKSIMKSSCQTHILELWALSFAQRDFDTDLAVNSYSKKNSKTNFIYDKRVFSRLRQHYSLHIHP